MIEQENVTLEEIYRPLLDKGMIDEIPRVQPVEDVDADWMLEITDEE